MQTLGNEPFHDVSAWGTLPPEKPRRSRARQFWLSLALASLTLAAFAPLLGRGFGFVNADDDDYVTDNADVLGGLSASGVRWAFTTFHAYNWHPLTWLSLQFDAQLFGAGPVGFHRTNLALHVLNVLLLFWALSRLTGAPGRSAFVAALFAVHPLHVESVAWIAERKDVLSTLFWMLTLLAYAFYVERPGLIRYLGVLFAFALGLLAKPMLVTLPCVLLLLDYWPLGRFEAAFSGHGQRSRRAGRLFLEKVPLLLLSGASSVITMLAQQRIVKGIGEFSLRARLGNALVSYLAYIGKMVWPTGLTIFYPHPGERLSWAAIVLAALLLVGVTAAVFSLARRRGYLTIGWLWYVGTLVPVIGLVQVGNQGMADRYTYVPLIGLFIILSWAVVDVARRFRLPLGLPAGLGVLLVVACALATTRQLRFWRDSIALWTRAVLTVRPAPAIARYYLGRAFDTAGQKNKALDQYAAALDANPFYPGVNNRMGELLYEQDLQAAQAHFEEELKINPESFQAHTGLGDILKSLNELEPARRHYAEALRLHADEITHGNLGLVLRRQGKLAQAAEQFRAALAAAPSSAEAHNNMGLILEDQGKLADALAQYREAVKLDGGKRPVFRFNLALALSEQGQLEEAKNEYRIARELAPDLPREFAKGAWNLATAARDDWRNGRIALHLAKQACQAVDPPPARSLDALAAAYAECGDFRRAVEFAEKAMRSALAADDTRLAAETAARIELYRKGLPYRQPAQEPVAR